MFYSGYYRPVYTYSSKTNAYDVKITVYYISQMKLKCNQTKMYMCHSYSLIVYCSCTCNREVSMIIRS